MTGTIYKGYCVGCPFDIGKPATEMGFNLGCLTGVGEIATLCNARGTAWACHSESDKFCCGRPTQHAALALAKPAPQIRARMTSAVPPIAAQ